MSDSTGPIIIAFDGSPAAIEAVERSADLLGTAHEAVILTVWEPGLMNAAVAPIPGGLGAPVPPPDIEQVKELDKSEHDHADRIAAEGVAAAVKSGLKAVAEVARDETSVASTILRVAEERNAAAIVIGSRRHSAIASMLLGSTTEAVLHKTSRPLVVIRPSDSN
jgi:nucleotide-binding universal stress UspA family protein